MKRWITAAAALLAAFGAQAQDSSLRPYLGFGITAGGETLASVQYTNGDTQKIKSGGLIELVGGLRYHQDGAPFSVRASIAYHVDDTNARDGSVKFSRWPVELLAFWHADEKFHLGAGLRKATGTKLSSSGAANNVGDYSFDSEAGFVVEAEYLPLPRLAVALRYVNEKYTLPGGKIDGSHAGVRVAWYF